MVDNKGDELFGSFNQDLIDKSKGSDIEYIVLNSLEENSCWSNLSSTILSTHLDQLSNILGVFHLMNETSVRVWMTDNVRRSDVE